MFRQYGTTEITFPARWPGEDVQVMQGIIKHSRRRQRAGKVTEGVASGYLNYVNSRLRCFGIAAREFPCQPTGGTVSVAPYCRNML